MFRYEVFGLRVVSDVYFPELCAGEFAESHRDVTIQTLPYAGPYTDQAERTQFSFTVDEDLWFDVTNGTRITIYRRPDCDLAKLRVFTLGSAFGALLMQRGEYPLHGSALRMYGQTVIVTGDSGAGKSTLAHTFIERAHTLVSDDVCAIRRTPHGYEVQPAYPLQKLWGKELVLRGKNVGDYEPIFDTERDKYNVYIY
ncbi:MAG: HPr kinase/phosphorylase, partial [Bacilli bacterium]